MLLSCCMTLFVLDSSISFFMSHDLVTMLIICDVMLIPNHKFQNENKNKIEIRKELKIIRVHCLQF